MFKPRSILQLTITGFLLVSGILIITLVITVQQLDGLGLQSQRMISESAEAMNASRILLEQAAAMERNARQYTIVGDRSILEVYSDRRRTLTDVAQRLLMLDPDSELSTLVNELVLHESRAFESLNTEQHEDQQPNLTYYPQIIEGANRISILVNDWINDQSEAIRLETEETKRLLTIQSGLLVSIALFLAGVFTVLITSPLLQIEKAINQLGSGVYKTQIAIKGPKDLIKLGDRLDWLRSRLEKLEQQRTSFLRHVSHELKTPLASMQESSSLLQDGVVGKLSQEQLDIIQIQNKNCRRLQSLIDNLLRYNSASFATLNPIPEPLRLDKVLDAVIEAHELTIKTRELHIKSSLEKISIKGNAEQLRVVFDNLITNAINYSPVGGVIEIKLKSLGKEAQLEVIDQGPGVPEEESQKIFEAFFQGKNTINNHAKSTGLGLAIATEYIQANGGRIELVSGSHGAHFKAVIPINREDA